MLIHNIKDEQPTFIIDPASLKHFYLFKYSDVVVGRHKLAISDHLFPPTQTLDIETLDWEPAIVTFGLPGISSCPLNEPYKEGSIRNRPETDKYVNGESVLEHLKLKDREIRAFISKKQNHAIKLLENVYSSVFERSSTKDYHDCQDKPYRFNQRAFEMVTNLTLRWMKKIDQYLMDSYNGTSPSEEDNKLLRIKLEFSTKDYLPTVVSLILRRAIGFCKVIHGNLYGHRNVAIEFIKKFTK